MRTRVRYTQPPAIAERSWAIFTAYYYEERTPEEIARTWTLSPEQVRRIVAEVDAQLQLARSHGTDVTPSETPLENLGLSVRTRNSLHSLGCHTVEDALRLDLSSSLRGVGQKTRQELLVKLSRAGFHHPVQEGGPASDIRGLERSLERIETRIGSALGAVTREVRLLRRKLRQRRVSETTPPCEPETNGTE